MAPLKVLVTGSPRGSLGGYFKKLTSLQAKHSFDLCLALDLFSDVPDDSIELAQLLAGQIKSPVQIYAAVGGGTLPAKVLERVGRGEEVAENVILLGSTGLLTLASGLRLATFGGLSVAASAAPTNTSFTTSDVTSFLSLLSPPAPKGSSLPSAPPPPPDILLTHSLPSSLPLLSSKAFLPTVGSASDELDQVAQAAKAKYHFVGGAGAFWEREPFVWTGPGGGAACRAISLGEMGNKAKDRWFYAFSITPRAAPGPAPAGTTASPFSAAGAAARGTKRPAGQGDEVNEFGVPNFIFGGAGGDKKRGKNGKGGPPPEHYTCNICSNKGHWIQECPEKEERDAARAAEREAGGDALSMRANAGGARPPPRPIQPDECWFCLSNPKVTKHLIASIGTEVYVTLPKGGLVEAPAQGESSGVPGGGHVLIIPIAHYQTLRSIPADAAGPILEEVDAYKAALSKCYAQYGSQLVAFEVGRIGGKGGHAHVQVVPIPDALADKAEEHYRGEGDKCNIPFLSDDEAAGVLARPGGDNAESYFRIDLPNGKVLLHIIPGRFDLQFGRTATALLLGKPERIDWKACAGSSESEKEETQAFKKAFAAFDPSE